MRTIVTALSAALLAAALPAAADVKIGVVDTQSLLRNAPQIQAADAKFKGEFQKREDDLKAEVKRLGDDERRFQREGDTMTAQQRATTSKDLYTRRTDLELKQRQFNDEARARNDELQRDVREKMKRAIDEVAREKGLGLIIQDPPYADKGLDVTADIIAKLGTYGAEPAAPDTKKKKK
jgi:outer membrane protein